MIYTEQIQKISYPKGYFKDSRKVSYNTTLLCTVIPDEVAQGDPELIKNISQLSVDVYSYMAKEEQLDKYNYYGSGTYLIVGNNISSIDRHIDKIVHYKTKRFVLCLPPGLNQQQVGDSVLRIMEKAKPETVYDTYLKCCKEKGCFLLMCDNTYRHGKQTPVIKLL